MACKCVDFFGTCGVYLEVHMNMVWVIAFYEFIISIKTQIIE